MISPARSTIGKNTKKLSKVIVLAMVMTSLGQPATTKVIKEAKFISVIMVVANVWSRTCNIAVIQSEFSFKIIPVM
jgi:hypothetical protein